MPHLFPEGEFLGKFSILILYPLGYKIIQQTEVIQQNGKWDLSYP